MKIYLSILFILNLSLSFAQSGINTKTPKKTFHIHGSLQVTNELNVGGDAETVGSPGKEGQVLLSNGADKAPSWETLLIPQLPELATGTVIAIDGKLMIAQEITVQMSQDFAFPNTSGNAIPIENLDVIIIDNELSYQGNQNTNSFRVTETGVYSITMNLQLISRRSSVPVIGVWDNQMNNWVARVNDHFVARNNNFQTYTLITAIEMHQDKVYSFRTANSVVTTIRSHSFGNTGRGPVSQITLKRLK